MFLVFLIINICELLIPFESIAHGSKVEKHFVRFYKFRTIVKPLTQICLGIDY